MRRASRTPNKTTAERAGAGCQAAKGIPSGPGVELLEKRIESRTASRSGAEMLGPSTCLV